MTTQIEVERVTFKSIEDEDFPFLRKIYRSTREEELSRTPWTEDQKEEFIRHQFYAQHIHYQKHYKGASLEILIIKDQPAGRLYLHDRIDEIRIMDITLLPEFRGQGWGSRIIEEIQKMAGKHKKGVGIHVEKNNPAMNLYVRLGFVKKEDKGVYDFMRWDPVMMEQKQK